MMSQSPALLLIVPLFTAFAVVLAGWFERKWHFVLGSAALTTTAAFSVDLLVTVLNRGPLSYRLGGWAPTIGIEYVVDYLSAIVLVMIAGVALLNFMAMRTQIDQFYGEKAAAFTSLYLMTVAGHLGIVITGDAFNLYVLIEIAALTGYALLAMGNDLAPVSTLRYLFMGTVGASFYLIGVGYLYIMTGSLNMHDVAQILSQISQSLTLDAAFGLILVGLWVKMAFFPMHGWLPSAYSDAASPASALIAPLTTKVMVYVMIRMMVFVFRPSFGTSMLAIHSGVVWLASIGIFCAAIFALAQRDLKRMLTYVLISEVGYMVGGAWLANRAGLTGAILHIVNDGVMTFCVFLAAAALSSRLPSLSFESLQGVFRKMPLTMGVFVIGGLAMIGVPPTCGFFSKWYLLSGALQAGQYQFAAALVTSSLVNVVLFFRVFEIGYFEPFAQLHGNGHGVGHGTSPAVAVREADWQTVSVLLLTAAALFALGLSTNMIVTRFIEPMISFL